MSLLALAGSHLRTASGGGGGDTLVETVTLDNFSGASRTDPYVTFARNFTKGAVPSGSRVEIRYGGSAVSLQQADGRATWGDGSLKRAVFACKPGSGAIADNGTLSLDLYSVSGSFSNSTSIARSTLTGQDYKIRVKIGGTNYYCVLNNLDTAGTYRERRAGNTVRAWHHYGVFRAGTGGSDTDQGQLQGHFYSYVWSDGTITVWPYVIFGRAAASALYTVDEIEFLNGASSIWSYLSSFSTNYSTALFCVGTDGLPHWSANATHFHPRADGAYWYSRRLGPNIYSTGTQRAAISLGSVPSYSPADRDGDYGTSDINSGGASDWIGHLTKWSANAMLLSSDASISASTRKNAVAIDRINALAMGVKQGPWVVRHDTGHPPNYLTTDFTADGLGSSMNTFTWQNGAAGQTACQNSYAGSVTDSSHAPAYGWYQVNTSGWEWWLDYEIIRCCDYVGGANADTNSAAYRNPKINGVHYEAGWSFFSQGRSIAWRSRDFGNVAFAIPDAHPCKNMMQQYLANGNAIVTELFTSPGTIPDLTNYNGYQTLGMWPTAYGDDTVWSPWHFGYLCGALTVMIRREQMTTSHKAITEFMTKQMLGYLSACAFNALGVYAVAIKEGSGGSGSINGTTDGTWNYAYVGAPQTPPAAIDNATACTRKLVSADGTSGSCPVSGAHVADDATEAWGVGHRYPHIHQGWLEMASDAGVSGVSSLLTYTRALETAAAPTEADWAAAQSQWRIRAA